MRANKVLFTIFALALGVSVSGFSAWEQGGKKVEKGRSQGAATRKGLQLSIKIAGEDYSIGDIIQVNVQLKNISKRPLVLYKELSWGGAASLNLYITDSQGRELIASVLDDTLPHPPFYKEDFITLEPGETLTQVGHVDLHHYEVKESEKYFITVSYTSPIPKEFAPAGLDIWAAEDGRLVSKPVRFKVLSQRQKSRTSSGRREWSSTGRGVWRG